MIDVEDLVALVHNYNPRANVDLIRKAYAYGMKVHEGQFRHSGNLTSATPLPLPRF